MTTQLHLDPPSGTLLAPRPPAINQLPLYLALIPLLWLIYQNLFVPLRHFPSLPLADIGVAMFVAMFSLLHNLYTFGWRSTLALLGITLVVA